MNNKTEIIAFFSSEGFFRLKSEEKQKSRFDELKETYASEFGEPLHDDLFAFLRQYQSEQAKTRKEREKKRLLAKNNLPIVAGCNKPTDHIKHLPAGRYVLTAAQNNTHVNEIMLNCLMQFCKHKDAKLLIGRLTYNKSGFAQPDIDANGLWYDKKIRPFLVHGHIDLQGAHFLADSNIIPTAKNPLNGFSAATEAGEHVILPHTKIALQVDAALKGSRTKIVCSSGAITSLNYIMRKAGSVASLEHCIGAVFVDTTDKNNIIIRHLELTPDNNYFYDLDYIYTENSYDIVENHVAALQPGDIHAEKMEEKNLQHVHMLIDWLKPKNLCIHDVIDFSSRNHHNTKNCAFIHLQTVLHNTVEKDLIRMAEIIRGFAERMLTYGQIHIIESNHDLALMRWLQEADFKQDPINAVTYLKCMLALYEHQQDNKESDNFNMLEFAYYNIANGPLLHNLNFNETDTSLIISGVEMGNHGHNGTNGAKASPASFRKLGIPMNTGHTHSPSITGRVYTAGVTASLEMGYNKGASSWEIAHIITYTNGQRQILFT